MQEIIEATLVGAQTFLRKCVEIFPKNKKETYVTEPISFNAVGFKPEHL